MSKALINSGSSIIGKSTIPKKPINTTRQFKPTTSYLTRDLGTKSTDNNNHDTKEVSGGEKSSNSFGRVAARDQLDIIGEANKIMRERTKTNGSTLSSKVKSKSDYLHDNKEICLKNYLIDLLKENRTEINDKELAISKSLKESENRLERDYKDFLSFVEREKIRQKDQETKYLIIKNNNDEMKINEKNKTQENKQILDELERTVKMILNHKSYAVFVHNVLGVESDFANNAESDAYMEQRDKNVESVCEKLIDDFASAIVTIDDESEETKFKFLEDPTHLKSKFIEMEENVLKLMEKKNAIEKELKHMDETNKLELEELMKREKVVKEEKFKLLQESNKDVKFLSALKSHNVEGDSKEHLAFIYELFMESSESDLTYLDDKKFRRKNENINYIKELMDMLRNNESSVINLISELEEIYDDKDESSLVRVLINKRKERNKESKQMMKKKAQDYSIYLYR